MTEHEPNPELVAIATCPDDVALLCETVFKTLERYANRAMTGSYHKLSNVQKQAIQGQITYWKNVASGMRWADRFLKQLRQQESDRARKQQSQRIRPQRSASRQRVPKT